MGPSYNHQRHRRHSKLDEYRDIIESKYAESGSARSIFDFIVEKGFTVTNVQYFLLLLDRANWKA